MSADDDITPAPVSGETAEQYRRRITAALRRNTPTPGSLHIDPERSKISLSITRAITVVIAIVASAAAVVATYYDLRTNVRDLKAGLDELRVSAAKLENRIPDVREAAAKGAAVKLRASLNGARVRLQACERPRADGQRDCDLKVLFIPEE
ncbi:MAG TPA: hypothetical protein VFJ24_07125 [Gaiellales bacterium]|nr:hypothetical protein [Gaiellales bacterium]